MDNTGNKKEAVNHPIHYNCEGYECIDVMIDVFGLDATINFCHLNAFKYIWRSNKKNGKEDLEKAAWYTQKEIDLLRIKEMDLLKLKDNK